MEILGILLLFAGGFALATSLAPNMPGFERLAISYGLGSGLVVLVMFYLSIYGLSLSASSIGLVLILIIGINALYTWKRGALSLHTFPGEISLSDIKKSERLLLMAILILGLCGSVLALYWPVWDWDGISCYDVRSKSIYYERMINVSWSEDLLLRRHRWPPLTSFLHAWIYFCGGENPKVIYPLFYLSLLGGLYIFLRRQSSCFTALFFTLLLASTPIFLEHTTLALTNLPGTYYISLGLLYMLAWTKGGQMYNLVISSIFWGLGCWTRPEAPVFTAAFTMWLGLFCWKNSRPREFLLFISLLLVLGAPWPVLSHAVSPTEPVYLGLDIRWLIWVLVNFFTNLLSVRHFGIIGYLFIAVVFSSFLRKRLVGPSVLQIVGIYMVAWMAIYYLVGADPRLAPLDTEVADITGSGIRTIMPLVPLQIYYCCSVLESS